MLHFTRVLICWYKWLVGMIWFQWKCYGCYMILMEGENPGQSSVPWITTATHTHTRQSHWSCDQETFTRKSDWIKAVMSSYHQIEGINVFVSTDVINRTQEATRHCKVGWQTDPRTINRRRWKNYDQQAERDREWEWERKVLTPTLRVKIKTVVEKARETVISVLDIWYNVL